MLDSRKTTSFERLDKKVEEYINLAKGIVNDDMDVEERYNALAGLYKHIDSENGGYVDMLKEEPDDKVDNYIRKQNIDTESQAPRTGNSLSKLFDYLKKKESEITLRSTVNGVEHYAFGMNWLPQDGVIPAQVLLFILMEMIRQDGEYYWLRVKIRSGKELPKFWEKKSFREELDEIIKQQGIEAEERNRQFLEEMNNEIRETTRMNQGYFHVPETRVAPDGRPIMEYSEEIQKIQREQQADLKTRNRLRREKEMELIREMGEEDRIWQPQPGKKVSRQNLYFSIGRYVDDINYYLDISDNNRSIESDLRVFRGLRNVLSRMLNDNGGYALKDMKIDPLLVDIHYPEEEDYGFRELLKYTEEQAEGGFDVWWIKKNATGLTNAEIIFSLISMELGRDVQLRYDRLKDMDDVLTNEDRKPFWKSTNEAKPDNNQDESYAITNNRQKESKSEKKKVPTKTKAKKKAKVVSLITETFEYSKDGQNSGNNYRLGEVFTLMKAQKLIATDTDQKQFLEIFYGGHNHNKIAWTGYKNMLHYFFNEWVNKRKYVKKPTGVGIWQLVAAHFYLQWVEGKETKMKTLTADDVKDSGFPENVSDDVECIIEMLNPSPQK